jgi:hypothetical protein
MTRSSGSPNPEPPVTVAAAAVAFLQAVLALLESDPRPADPPSSRVQHVRLDADGPA